jgi:hypothetical protein
MTIQKENNLVARARYIACYILLYPVGTLGPKKAWTTRTGTGSSNVIKSSCQLPFQPKIPDLAKGCVLITLLSWGRGLLCTLLTEVLLLSLWRHFRGNFTLVPNAALLTLLSTTQVALVRFVNLATGAKVETRFHD